MQTKTALITVLAACITNAAAQLSGLPTCAQSCATNAIPSSCGDDVECICSASSFITDVSCCIATACDAADQATTLQYADELCAGAGVSNLPSAAACSATSGTASATAASGSTTLAATTTASAASSGTSAAGSSTAVATSSKSAVSSMASSTGSSTGSSSASSSTSTGAAPVASMGAGVGAAVMLAAMALA